MMISVHWNFSKTVSIAKEQQCKLFSFAHFDKNSMGEHKFKRSEQEYEFCAAFRGLWMGTKDLKPWLHTNQHNFAQFKLLLLHSLNKFCPKQSLWNILHLLVKLYTIGVVLLTNISYKVILCHRLSWRPTSSLGINDDSKKCPFENVGNKDWEENA